MALGMSYDLIVVGAGIAGSSLARRMAQHGARVLLVERETEFRDRVRGEAIVSWGVAECVKLGIDQVLAPHVAQLRTFAQYIGGQPTMRRDLPATNPHAQPFTSFYHPTAQEVLLAAAAHAG